MFFFNLPQSIFNETDLSRFENTTVQEAILCTGVTPQAYIKGKLLFTATAMTDHQLLPRGEW